MWGSQSESADGQNLYQKQPVNNARLSEHNVVCGCLPLRTAVFVNALGTVVLSILLLFFREAMDDSLRVFTGGYSLQGRVAVDLIEISGCLWGVIGIIGAVYLKTSYVRIYMYYQVARLFSWLIMYLTDVPLLWSCELWMTDLDLAVKTYGWNHIMYDLAVNSRCQEERILFTTLSTLCLLGFSQLTLATQQLLSDLEEEPRYLLTLPQNSPSGAFYTQSLASRSLIAQQKEQEERAANRSVHAPPSGPFSLMNPVVGPPTGVAGPPPPGQGWQGHWGGAPPPPMAAPGPGGGFPGGAFPGGSGGAGTAEFGPHNVSYGSTPQRGPAGFNPAP